MTRARVVCALAVFAGAAFAGDGRAAPRRLLDVDGTVDSTINQGVNLGVVPLPPAGSVASASAVLAVAAIDRKVADLDAEEERAKGELASLSGRISDARKRTLTRGRAFYRLTRAGMLPVGGGFDALVSHAMRVERGRRSLGAEIESEKQLRARGGELSRVLERVARDRVALLRQRTELDAARVAAVEESRRQQAFDRAFAESAGPTSSGAGEYVAVHGGSSAAEDSGPTFASARGKLLFPLPGRADVTPARREGTDGPGLEIRAPMGSAVRAVFGGRVAFADRYGAYGRLVILDHGNHYYSVSGNLASFDVRVGDELSAGERIGSVGDEGKGAMLYFEIRRGTETLAPGPWLGL